MGASSKPGLGSQFWFTMHLKRDAQRVDARHAELADLRILVVDHVPANRQIAAEVLSQWGCRAECASSALAVERMSEAQRSGDPFRMLIAGQRMAEQEAESLAQTVKADPQLRDTVLVMVAANPTPQGCRDSLKAGFTEYIERPSGISDIYKGMVRAWLESQHPSPPAAAILKSPDRSDPTRLSILVVDDNAEDRAALARTLEEFGGQAETAASGQQALEMWGARSYNLILMDCDMPDLDGYETTTEIRGLEQLMSRDPNRPSRTPIVAMLEGSVGVSRVKCVARGMDGGLTKPLSRGTIESLLQRFAPALALAEKSNRR
jgi:CheY-like chemotaxis protein